LISFPGWASSLLFVGISDAFQLPQITAEPFVPHPLCFSFYDCRVDSFPRQREITVEVVLEIFKVSSNEVELVEAGQIQMDDSFMSVFSSMDSERQCASALTPLPPSRVAYHVHRDALTAGLVVPCCPRATPGHAQPFPLILPTHENEAIAVSLTGQELFQSGGSKPKTANCTWRRDSQALHLTR
jgi:hypothetical protein